MGKVVLYSTVSVDGFIADERDQPGPLFDWLSAGDVPLDDAGQLKVSQASADVTRAYWDEIGVTVVGRHVFDLTNGWGGVPPSGIDHVVVVSHRPAPEGWDLNAPFRFVDGIQAAMAEAQALAGDRMVEVAAGEVAARCWPRGSSTRSAWTSRPSCSASASASSGGSTRRICSRTRRGRAGHPGAPPAPPSAPMTDP